MKYLRLALVFSAIATCQLHAQRGEPEPIPDFSNLDEYIYEPKTTLHIGVRAVNGAKTSFSGQGMLKAPEDPGNATDINAARSYHDGNVLPDARTTTINNPDGTTTVVPNAPDGKTNTWNFLSDKQSAEAPGYIAMHTYSAEITDTKVRTRDGKGSAGLDLSVSRDMGNVFRTRITWNLTAGMTVSDISANHTDSVRANLTTLTDLYSLFGELAPGAPYSAPSQSTVTVTDASGNPVLNADGTNQTVTTDTTVLIGNSPANRSTSVKTDETSVTNQWKLKGAYFTFRAGPSLTIPIGGRFRASVGVGASLVYAGSTYSVKQSYQPETGFEINETVTADESKLLPGFYADAMVQFDLTPRTGLYAGAGIQNSGDYEQVIATTTANYASKLEFGTQQNFRAGMSIKF